MGTMLNDWVGEWTAVDWSGAAGQGQDPDPCGDERVITITDQGAHFARTKKRLCYKKTSKEWLATTEEMGTGNSFTILTEEDEKISFKLLDDLTMKVDFGYAEPSSITYRSSKGLGAVTTQQPLSWWVGTWQASQWTAGARAGGDPDPTADEAELRVAADGTLNIGTDNLEGHVPAGGASLVYIPTGDKDVVAVTPHGQSIHVWFKSYKTPACVTYTRLGSPTSTPKAPPA